MIRNLYEFELSGLKVVRGQFVRLGNQINNSIRFFNILEREIAVYLLLSYDRNSFVGQYPFISFGIFGMIVLTALSKVKGSVFGKTSYSK